MCGIAAEFAYDGRAPAVDPSAVRLMCDRMSCRGPDGAGCWSDDHHRVVLGHRRLAIIDLSDGGAQPMIDHSGDFVISFNGEIYNHQALRRQLEAKGHRFRSSSDTEVLLRLYADRGPAMLQDLRGMFAFALWDGVKRGLLLARDPFGIKPLYCADDGRSMRVASEVKALLAAGADDREEPAGHVGFYLWGHVPEPFTLFRGIRALPAGTMLWVDERGPRQARRYASVSRLLTEAASGEDGSLDEGDVRDRLRDAALDTVRHHLVADVDVGVFLSSGLDSTTLVALAAELSGRLRTVTLGFEEYRGTPQDETPLAELVARRYGAEHRTIWITRNDFTRELPRILDRMDQPSIDGVNTYFVARAAAEAGLKVALSGLGGDELFAGYPSFEQIPRLVRLVGQLPAARTIGRGLRTLSLPFFGALTSPKYASLIEYGGKVGGAYLLRRALFMPWELPQLLDPELVRSGLRDLDLESGLSGTVADIPTFRLQISALEASWYMRNQLLRDTDWASMAHSVEVRVPLVDWTFWKGVAPLVHRVPSLGKQALASSPLLPLPASVLRRVKSGFEVPTRTWSLDSVQGVQQRGLRSWAQHVHEAARAPFSFA